ncbi:MAG TPA: lipid IV(A) 3-deoxy-D-manno-octulosonic acid transferase [Methylophilaceae bacterium]|nr:lipid IV(A) 3-deoxy-D-manno-octulosonic acid transferase [Methylophilaceae bacterium]
MPRLLYTLLLYLLLPLAPLKLLWRGRRQREYLQHWHERFAVYRAKRAAPAKPVIWLHCVSVGETRAAAPLVKELQARYPGHQILLTHATPTGRAAGEQLFGGEVQRVYLPYDLPSAANRFLRHFQPVIGLLMETELWFNLIAACAQQGIPLLLVNARLSQRSANGYAKVAQLTAQGLRKLTAIAAQTEQDAARLRSLGARQVAVLGNLKFDVKPPADALQQGLALRAQWGKARPVFLAASTREGEEALILDAIAKVQIPELLTVIVPRHPQRFEEVAELLHRRGLRYVRKSQLERGRMAQPPVDIVLGDSMGEMFTYYAACDIAFIGGSLLPFGGQNLIEACALGKPVLIGSHTFNFAEAADQAVAAEAALRVDDAEALALALQRLLGDEDTLHNMSAAALAFSNSATGATQRIAELVSAYLKKP